MVSIQGSLTLVALAVGVVLFFGAGGFKGVGQKIGGFFGQGFGDFSSSLSSAFTGGLFGGSTNAAAQTKTLDTGTIGPAPRTGTEDFDPIGNLIGNFKGLQNILDTLNNQVRNIFEPQRPGAIGTGFDFAVSQLRPGQTPADITIKPRQGTAVSRTGMRFVSNLGGRERAFGSQESLNSFVERFNR